jgi:hypothetical protein
MVEEGSSISSNGGSRSKIIIITCVILGCIALFTIIVLMSYNRQIRNDIIQVRNNVTDERDLPFAASDYGKINRRQCTESEHQGMKCDIKDCTTTWATGIGEKSMRCFGLREAVSAGYFPFIFNYLYPTTSPKP